MALEYVSTSTKVGEINKAIEIWKKVANESGNAEEKKYAQTKIEKLEYSRNKIVNLCKSKVGAVVEDTRKRALAHLMKDNFKELSIEGLNAILLAGDQVEVEDSELQGQNVGMDILEGKTGVEYMTVVKSTIAVSAIALLTQYGAFSAIGSGLSALAAINPVVAVCAVALGGATLIKLARKIFAPEIKKFVAKQKAEEKFNTQSSASDQEVDKFVKDEEQKIADEQQKIKDADEQAARDKAEAERVDKAKTTLIKEILNDTSSGNTVNLDDTSIKKYAQKYKITEEQVKEVLKDNGYTVPEPKNLGDTAKEISLSTNQKTGFNDFFQNYKNTVKAIIGDSKSPKEKAELIANLQKFADEPSWTDPKTGKTTKINNNKLKELCNGMCDMLRELMARAKEFEGQKAGDIRKQLESEHGLKASDFNNLTK